MTHCFVGEKKVVDYASTHSTPMYKGGKTSWSSFFHVIPCAGTPQTSCIDTFALLYKGARSSKVKHPSIPTLVSLQYLNLKAMQGFTSLYIGNPYLLPALRKAKSARTASKSLTLLMTAPPFPPFHCSRQVADFDCLALVETTRQKQKAVGSFDVSVHDTFASEAQ